MPHRPVNHDKPADPAGFLFLAPSGPARPGTTAELHWTELNGTLISRGNCWLTAASLT